MQKKFIHYSLIILTLMIFISCHQVPPGNVGLKVNLYGDDKGDIVQYGTGRYFTGNIGITRFLWFNFPTFIQNYVWSQASTEGSLNDESFTFSIEGLPVNIDVGIEYRLDPDKIRDIFVVYRRGIDEINNIVIRNRIRDAFNQYSKDFTIDTLISGGIQELFQIVEKDIGQEFIEIGIIINKISMVGSPRYPTSVQQAIESKIEATQKAVQRENELRESEAQAKKMLVEAQAEAESNKLKSLEITPEIIQMEWIKKWDGKLPTTLSGDSSLIIPIK